jgi:DNA-binding cell septation regulator SpoVG
MTDFSKINILNFIDDMYLISEENPLFEDCKKRSKRIPHFDQVYNLICIWVRTEIYDNVLKEFCKRENEKFQEEIKLTNVQQKILKKFSDTCLSLYQEYIGQIVRKELKASILYRLKSIVCEFENRRYFNYGTQNRFSFKFKKQTDKSILETVALIDGYEAGTHEYGKLLKQIVSMNFVYLKELDTFSPIQHSLDFSWYEDVIKEVFSQKTNKTTSDITQSFYDRYSYPDDKQKEGKMDFSADKFTLKQSYSGISITAHSIEQQELLKKLFDLLPKTEEGDGDYDPWMPYENVLCIPSGQ